MSELLALISTLADEEQIILKLHLVAGKSFQEIGELLKVPPSSVENLYRVARGKLMEKLSSG